MTKAQKKALLTWFEDQMMVAQKAKDNLQEPVLGPKTKVSVIHDLAWSYHKGRLEGYEAALSQVRRAIGW
jgi:hypothetical protein